MIEPVLEIDIRSEYGKYLRGCEELHWRAVGETEFEKNYSSYRLAKEMLDALKTKQLPWIRGAEAITLRCRWIWTTRKFKHLQEAVGAGSRASGDDGFAGAGVTSPLLLGPRSRFGSERLELPREIDGERAG